VTARQSSSHPPKQSSSREFSGRVPAEEDRAEIADDIRNAHDRAAGIILGSLVETYLQELLLVYLPNAGPEIFSQPNGPLTDFYAKSHLAFAMGIIPKALLKDIEVVRRVRNALAHALAPVRFLDGPVTAECQKMSAHPIHLDKEKVLAEEPEIYLRSERENFFYSVTQVILDLINLTTQREMSQRKN
jgi:hypothetical protein